MFSSYFRLHCYAVLVLLKALEFYAHNYERYFGEGEVKNFFYNYLRQSEIKKLSIITQS